MTPPSSGERKTKPKPLTAQSFQRGFRAAENAETQVDLHFSEDPPSNLPLELSSFIGREQEIAEVEKLLTGKTRLLTLTGPGGCGKTRLALRVARNLVEDFADGVRLVELASLSDPSLVPQAVASALFVREQPGRPLTDTLSDHLKHKKLLLVLDNYEHLIDACAALANTLLRACLELHIFATSREALGMSGEVSWLVSPLSFPERLRPLSPEELSQ
jgi:predicted ATPase